MIELTCALILLLLTHAVPSSTSVRPYLVRTFGLRGFRVLYSLLSVAVVVWLVFAYRGTADSPWLWTAPYWSRWLAVTAMPVALWLVASRLMQRPGQTRSGIYRLIPAPGSTGLTIWALLHLLNVGQARALLLFAAFAVISLAAAVKNTLASRQKPPQPLTVGDFKWHPLAAAIFAWLLLLAAHPHVIGVDPLLGIVP